MAQCSFNSSQQAESIQLKRLVSFLFNHGCFQGLLEDNIVCILVIDRHQHELSPSRYSGSSTSISVLISNSSAAIPSNIITAAAICTDIASPSYDPTAAEGLASASSNANPASTASTAFSTSSAKGYLAPFATITNNSFSSYHTNNRGVAGYSFLFAASI